MFLGQHRRGGRGKDLVFISADGFLAATVGPGGCRQSRFFLLRCAEAFARDPGGPNSHATSGWELAC
jgi:hypothetical protein